MKTKLSSISVPWVLVHLLLIVVSVVVIVPLLYLVISAFKTEQGFLEHTFLPIGEGAFGINWSQLTTKQFGRLFTSEIGIGRALVNSVFLSATTAVLATFICALAGYASAALDFKGKRAFDWLVLAALIIPPPLLIAPSYQWLHTLGLLDSYTGLILPAIAPAFGVFLFRQATLQSVPKSILEAARIDGLGEFGIFLVLALPMLRPMVGAFLIITFLAMWNNFIGPQIVLQSAEKQPLSVVIYQTQTAYYSDYGLLMAGTLVSILPVAALFLFLQRDFIAGLSSGAVKG
ncbi:MAG: carbohydrate ABC transporter permease [Phycisphaerales bacterium]